MPDAVTALIPSRTGPDDLAARVGDVLTGFLAEQALTLEAVSPDAVALADAVRDFVAGGKRLRPAFCYWAWRGAGGTATPAAAAADAADTAGTGSHGEDAGIVAAAASLELFQAAALMHDDVMDDSDTRRGRPAVHRQFASLHRDHGWCGDQDRFGLAGAVLAGDLCLSWSDALFVRAFGPHGLPPAQLAAGRAVFDTMRTELMGGQYFEMVEQARAGTGGAGDAVSRARRVIRYKSAKYSVEHPLLLGAALAGAPADLVSCYSTMGLLVGEAFQLRDDLLGVFGDPARTGKPAGDDLREGKRTVLVAFALEKADATERATVESLLGDPRLDENGVETLRGILVRTGAADRVESLIADDVDRAREALAAAHLPDEARAALSHLVTAATARAA